MATDIESVSDEFAETACKLIKEYSDEIERLRLDTIKVLDLYHDSGAKSVKSDEERRYLKNRFTNNLDMFRSFIPVYGTLVRKSSQWIQHAQEARPGKQLELDVRLEQFEQKLNAIQRFFDQNAI